MKREFVLVLALCAFAAAMVPRRRRAVDTETQNPTTMTEAPKRICQPNTLCGWDFYHEYSRQITQSVVNTYCECEKGMHCLYHEDDVAAFAYAKRCKVPSADSEAPET